MTLLGPLKPFLTNLIMPPAGPLLLMLGAAFLARYRRRLAWGLASVAFVSLWVLSCDATAYGLHRLLLHSYPPITTDKLQQAKAIVVLGGGVEPNVPEYDRSILGARAHMRLIYGVHLAKQSQLPLVYAGGKGWEALNSQIESEAAVAAYVLARDHQMRFAWVDDQSRDTRENAQRSHEKLHGQGIQTIALVTNDWHMQRSVRNFEQAGFSVVPAPMGYVSKPEGWESYCVPTASGLGNSRMVLREWLGLLFT
ncbi:MAG: hypothetical protein RI998_705 [Pseudomonadota bacterium]|jgi:uncharacterized SAM-binding protein YcdF (DUF218 family)